MHSAPNETLIASFHDQNWPETTPQSGVFGCLYASTLSYSSALIGSNLSDLGRTADLNSCTDTDSTNKILVLQQ